MKKIITLFIIVLCFLLANAVNTEAATVKLNKTSLTLNTDNSYTLTISGTSRTAKWTSSNKSVATVSTKGVVKGIKAGSATITATISSKKYTCKVTVPVIKLNKTSLSVEAGETYILSMSGTTKTVTWASSNKSIATISSKGVVKGIKAGTVTITATVSGKNYSCKVTTTIAKINKTSLLLNVGKSYLLSMSGTTKTVTWSSSDISIATISSKGEVIGIKDGKATITATISTKKYTCEVTVSETFAAEKAKTAIVKTEYNLGTEVVAILENTYRYPVSVEATVVYYDINGNMLGTSYDDNYYFESGVKCALRFHGPYDIDFNNVSYHSYKVTYKIEPVSDYMKSNYNDIKAKSNFGANNVMAEISNNGMLYPEFTNISIIFYKDGNIIGYDSQYAEVEQAGSTDYLEFWYPYDIDYDYIIPDSYELFINYSYSYLFNYSY